MGLSSRMSSSPKMSGKSAGTLEVDLCGTCAGIEGLRGKEAPGGGGELGGIGGGNGAPHPLIYWTSDPRCI